MDKKKIIILITVILILGTLIIAEAQHIQSRRLFEAIEANDYDQVYAAIQAGADVNRRYRAFLVFPELVGSNPTPLIEACYRNTDAIILLLLENGADVNRCDSLTNISPLYVSVGRRNIHIAYQLIERGADINVQAANYSILSLCCDKNKDPESDNHIMFRHLLKLNATLETPRGNILHDAVIAQDAYVVEYLLNHNLVNPIEEDRNGRSAMELAKELGYDQIAELLQRRT